MNKGVYVVMDAHGRIKQQIVGLYQNIAFIEDFLEEVDYLSAIDDVKTILSRIKRSASRLADMNSSQLDELKKELQKYG